MFGHFQAETSWHFRHPFGFIRLKKACKMGDNGHSRNPLATPLLKAVNSLLANPKQAQSPFIWSRDDFPALCAGCGRLFRVLIGLLDRLVCYGYIEKCPQF